MSWTYWLIRSVSLPESQHRVLERAGFYYQTGEGVCSHSIIYYLCNFRQFTQTQGPVIFSLVQGHDHIYIEGYGENSNKVMTMIVIHSCVPVCVKLSKRLHITLYLIFAVLNDKHYYYFEGKEPQSFNAVLKATAIKWEKYIQSQVGLTPKPFFSCRVNEICFSVQSALLTWYIFGDILLYLGPVPVHGSQQKIGLMKWGKRDCSKQYQYLFCVLYSWITLTSFPPFETH